MTTVNLIRKNSNRVRPGLRFQFDYWLLLVVAGLLVIGMLMVYSTTFDYGLRFYEEATYFFKRQLLALIVGIAGALIIMQFDYHVLRLMSVPFLIMTLVMLVVVLLFGETIFGARRGLLEGSYQPSEIAKLATILYISHWLSSKGDRIKNLTYGLLPFSVITGVVCALIVQQPDLGTTGLIAIVCFTLFFIAGADLRQFTIAGLVGGLIFLFLVTTLPHAAQRVDSYRIALRDPIQAGWQVQQSVVALATGGLFGVGLGESTQKFGPLPAAHTDGVFSILGEELGLVGCLVVMVLWALLVWRGISIARRARDGYGSLLALGVTCWLSFQALLNMAVVTAVVPFTGIPLPFLSYGGSSLASSLIGIGILLSISRDAAVGQKMQQPRKPARGVVREDLDLRRRDGRPHLSGAGRRR
ncbi:MAG: putative lipid II flippase FtsW [Chloroflexi bacterium]|nr:putative lipid II flippase FtsW [Chloroflexota bacterium]MCI0575394.1 putative lipid II flippase FtsW [Chloroflexota bacterium]MCI0645450.1 putative lipid II flippase FtsW [Chloroflexota bacterium]MCI0726717.1 putative lipid II flippase FtsW [Chloroflexota bacterium]